MPAKKLTAVFEREKETKGTQRFVEDADDQHEPIIGYIYLKKSADDKLGKPAQVHVTVATA